MWFLNRQWKSYFSSNAQNLCSSNSFFKAIQKNETRNNNNIKKMESIDCTCCAEPTINDGMFVVRSTFEWCMRESKLSKIKFYLQQSPKKKSERYLFRAAFDGWLWISSVLTVSDCVAVSFHQIQWYLNCLLHAASANNPSLVQKYISSLIKVDCINQNDVPNEIRIYVYLYLCAVWI